MNAHGTRACAHTHAQSASEGSHSDPAREQLNYNPDKPNEKTRERKKKRNWRLPLSVFSTVLSAKSEDRRLKSEGTEPGRHWDSASLPT